VCTVSFSELNLDHVCYVLQTEDWQSWFGKEWRGLNDFVGTDSLGNWSIVIRDAAWRFVRWCLWYCGSWCFVGRGRGNTVGSVVFGAEGGYRIRIQGNCNMAR
jgi:hypothetical protein